MTVWAIVPVKPLRRGKSRLSVALDEQDRLALNYCLLENTLQTLKAVPQIEQVLVVSRDPQALTLARACQARTIQESGAPRLNHALERATLFARQYAVQAVLIVPADLPLINTLDIQALLELATQPPVVIVTPDRHRKGTNALLVSPPGLLAYEFGENSFIKHSSQALELGARLEIFERPSLSLDLDLPEDLMLVRQQMQILDSVLFERIYSNGLLKPPGSNGGKMADDLANNERIHSHEIGEQDGK
jgi:2-phospho-L-lactate/phosphoenolpyruvate guanylyltransferase